MEELSADFPDLGNLGLPNNPENRTQNFMDLSTVLPSFDPVNGHVDIHR